MGPSLGQDTGYDLRSFQGFTDFLKPMQPGLALGSEIRYLYLEQGAATLPPVSNEAKLVFEFGEPGVYMIYIAAAPARELAGSPQKLPYNLMEPRFDASPASFGYYPISVQVMQ